MTPRYRTAFSVPSGFAATTPAAEAPAPTQSSAARGKISAATRAQAKPTRVESASEQRGSAAA